MRICKVFQFNAAHHLTEVGSWHPCARVHGHAYRVEVWVEGEVDRHGWLIDTGDIKAKVKPLIDELDHNDLNTVEGLENPTMEVLAAWLWMRIKPTLPSLCKIAIWETETGAVEYP